MDVYQCPDCELRFQFASELTDHLATSHPDFHAEDKSVEDALLKASHRHRHKEGYRAGHDKNAG
ncbi:MAG TPA: hypothetical protein VHJ82_06085 [Actinomycetota bacterium]|nr:hypothetical protein [Actinomycetota bacterium]